MSYDIWLVIDTGGDEPAQVGESHNYTSNTSHMWEAALGFSLGDIDGKPAGSVIADLDRAIAYMGDTANDSALKAMEPANGWGDRHGARRFLCDIRGECAKHPKASVRIWA